MGEAKRRSQQDPTWGVGKMEAIASMLRQSMSKFQDETGRGFFLTSDLNLGQRMVYIHTLEGTELQQQLRERDRVLADQLAGRLQDYDPQEMGLHIHEYKDEAIELNEFPLRLINPDGAIDDKAIGIFKTILELGSAKIQEV